MTLARMTARDVVAQVAAAFGERNLVVSEVGIDHGARRIDVVVVHCSGNYNGEVWGVEVKVDRQDLLNELSTPQKSERARALVDRWWLACPAGLLRKDDAVPASWGVLEVTKYGEGFRVKRSVRAPLLRPDPTGDLPKAVDRAILRSLAGVRHWRGGGRPAIEEMALHRRGRVKQAQRLPEQLAAAQAEAAEELRRHRALRNAVLELLGETYARDDQHVIEKLRARLGSHRPAVSDSMVRAALAAKREALRASDAVEKLVAALVAGQEEKASSVVGSAAG